MSISQQEVIFYQILQSSDNINTVIDTLEGNIGSLNSITRLRPAV